MVNYGVSKGCETCKQRRKKCDEARPSCQRCIKANIICLGYREETDLLFRNYAAESSAQGVQMVVSSGSPQSLSDLVDQDNELIEQKALAHFFHDYWLPSSDQTISRGFLDGLEILIDRVGPDSGIARAIKLVSLAGIANRLQRQSLLDRTRFLYSETLRYFQVTMSDGRRAHSLEALMTAVLLGIYEIVACTNDNVGQHVAHVRGVAAILQNAEFPLDLAAPTDLFQMDNPSLFARVVQEPKTIGVLCQPIAGPFVQNLDTILLRFGPLLDRARELVPDTNASIEDIQALLIDAEELNASFRSWPNSHGDAWLPKPFNTTNIVTRSTTISETFWPNTAYTYFDIFVSAVWNTYRKSHMMVLDLIVTCKHRRSRIISRLPEEAEALGLVEDIRASIPFHLTGDLTRYFTELQNSSSAITPGRPVGGLLIFHAVYVAANLNIVPPLLRAEMRECLGWISTKMGIGQAGVLSNPHHNLSFKQIAEGHLLIWAGMLIKLSPNN